MRLSLSEIIEQCCALPADQRATFLRNNRSEALERILQYALDPRAIWLLPKGEIPFQRNVDHDLHTVLYYESRLLYAFVEGGEPNLKPKKRLLLFIEMLERLNGRDADLMMRVKDQNLPPEITVDIVNAAFPNLVYVKPKAKPGPKPKEVPPPDPNAPPKVRKKPGPKPGSHHKKKVPPAEANTAVVEAPETPTTPVLVSTQGEAFINVSPVTISSTAEAETSPIVLVPAEEEDNSGPNASA